MIEELMHMLSDPAHLLFELVTTVAISAATTFWAIAWSRGRLHRELDAEHGVPAHGGRYKGRHRRGKLQPVPEPRRLESWRDLEDRLHTEEILREASRVRKPCPHIDRAYDGYWISCNKCGARRRPGKTVWETL